MYHYDGIGAVGWKEVKNNLEETYEVSDNLYNINDLENGIVDKLINLKDYFSSILKMEIKSIYSNKYEYSF